MQTAIPAVSAEPDTLKVNSVGENNQVILNSQQLGASSAETPGAPVRGEIKQTGENNIVEIKTSSKKQKTNSKTSKASSKKQNTNNKTLNTNSKAQKANNKIQKPGDKFPGNGDQYPESEKHHIRVTQTGKNNSVKINSR